jgi:chromate reductase
VTTIIGLSGALRQGSYNMMLLRAAAAAAPPDSRIEIASIRGIPLYDGDVEANDGVPPAVQALKEAIAGADGLLLVTPEYNNSLPGVFKNAIDWLSRPPADIGRVFRGRPVAIIGATPGAGGTNLAQAAWLPVIRTLGMAPWFGGRLAVANAGKVFSAEGELLDAAIRDRLEAFVSGYVEFVRATRSGRLASRGPAT